MRDGQILLRACSSLPEAAEWFIGVATGNTRPGIEEGGGMAAW